MTGKTMLRRSMLGVTVAVLGGLLYPHRHDKIVYVKVSGVSQVTYTLTIPGETPRGRPMPNTPDTTRYPSFTLDVIGDSLNLPIPVPPEAVSIQVVGTGTGAQRLSCEIWQAGTLRTGGMTDGEEITCDTYIRRDP